MADVESQARRDRDPSPILNLLECLISLRPSQKCLLLQSGFAPPPICSTADCDHIMDSTAQESPHYDMPEDRKDSAPRWPKELPFPHLSAKLSLALTAHADPGYPLYANSPILLPRRRHRIFVRSRNEQIWYWTNVPDTTVIDLLDTLSEDSNNASLALVRGDGVEIRIDEALLEVPLSHLKSRLQIMEEGDLRFALWEDTEE